MKNIESLINHLCNEIDSISDIDSKIDVLNKVKRRLHEVSPLKHHPVDCVVWERSDNVEANDYNPNVMAPPEEKGLHTSIILDGYTMPVVTAKGENTIEIVDGFHRRKSERTVKEISDSTFGRVPISSIRSEQNNRSSKMASTIRHNRARGTHDVDLMVNIVGELVELGMSDNWIIKQIGMDKDELLRLKQISGIAALFTERQFSKAWE